MTIQLQRLGKRLPAEQQVVISKLGKQTHMGKQVVMGAQIRVMFFVALACVTLAGPIASAQEHEPPAIQTGQKKANALLFFDVKTVLENPTFAGMKLSDSLTIEDQGADSAQQAIDAITQLFCAIRVPSAPSDAPDIYLQLRFEDVSKCDAFYEFFFKSATDIESPLGPGVRPVVQDALPVELFVRKKQSQIQLGTVEFLKRPPNEIPSSRVKDCWASLGSSSIKIAADTESISRSPLWAAVIQSGPSGFASEVDRLTRLCNGVGLAIDLKSGNLIDIQMKGEKREQIRSIASGFLFQGRVACREFVENFGFKSEKVNELLLQQVESLMVKEEPFGISISVPRPEGISELYAELNQLIVNSRRAEVGKPKK